MIATLFVALNADTNNFLYEQQKIKVKPTLEKNFVYLKDTKKTFNKKELETFLKDYKKTTGETDEGFKKQLEFSSKDEYFQTGLNSIFLEKKLIELPTKQKVFIPNWKEALENFKKSAELRKNPHAAFIGLDIVNNFQLTSPSQHTGQEITKDVIDVYMPIFSKTLSESGYCYGYLYQVKFYSSYRTDYDKAMKIGEAGVSVCEKQIKEKRIYLWIDLGFRKEFVKAKTILQLQEKKKGD